MLNYGFYASTKKITPEEELEGTDTYNIALAKNEYESCQLIINNKEKKELFISFSPFINNKGEEIAYDIFEEKYIKCESDKDYGTYPDILIKRGKSFSLKPKHTNLPLYIRLHSEPTTTAGIYKAKIKVSSSEGSFIIVLTARVWNFELPSVPFSDTAVGIEKNSIEKLNKPEDKDELNKIYKSYYDYLLSRHISAYDLPYDILDPRADAYMSNPNVKSFLIPYCENDDNLLVKYYKKVTSDPVWAAKAYFYPIDEPTDTEAYNRYNKITERLEKLCPGFHMVTPSNTEKIKYGDQEKLTTVLQEKSDIFCGVSRIFDDFELRKDAARRHNEGSKIWWYICCDPHEPYCNMFIHWDGLLTRLLFWQQKYLNIEGFLYWSSTFWRDVDDPAENPLTSPWTGNTAFGDGSLFYPIGKDFYTSLRLEELADGLEDFDLLTIAEEILGRPYIEERIKELSTSLKTYTKDDDFLITVRNKICKDIEDHITI